MAIQLDSNRVWTYDDYLQLPNDGHRYEIIEGVLHVSPSPFHKHQLMSRRMKFFFYQFELEGSGFIYNAPMDLLMPGCTPVQPDLIFLRRDQRHLIKEKFIEGVPYLLVEILSSDRAYDRVKKMNIYAKNGVPYYLIVDPEDPSLEVFRLDGALYRVEHSLSVGDSWTWEGKTLDLSALFAPLPDP